MIVWLYLIRLCLLEGKRHCLRSVEVSKAAGCIRVFFGDCSRIG